MNQKKFNKEYGNETLRLYESGLSTRKIHKELRSKGIEATLHNVSRSLPADLKAERSSWGEEYFKKLGEKFKIDSNNIKYSWAKDEEDSALIHNPLFKDNIDIDEIYDKFREIAKDFSLGEIKNIESKVKPQDKLIQVIITDEHVGMDVSSDRLFQYKYNADIYREKYKEVFANVVKEFKIHGKVKEIRLLNLGDGQDGWNKETTRGGHKLSQNMTNGEVFDVFTRQKLAFIKSIYDYDIAEKVSVYDEVNDNHSGDFGEICVMGVNIALEAGGYNAIERVKMSRFMEHFIFGEHCFIYTHGKDKSLMQRNLPLHLNDRTVNFINEYIEHYNIKSKYIHVYKGDLHQIGYDRKTKFDYVNFMSFAPPSNWVQHNFGDAYSGYCIEVIPADINEITRTNYFLDYKKL